MTATFEFFLVDESKIPSELPPEWTYDDKQEHLAELIRSTGASWGRHESDPVTFHDALTIIDGYIGGTRVLPVYGLNYSPHKVLELDGGHPRIGYYKPALVKDLNSLLQRVQKIVDSDPEESHKLGSLLDGEVDNILYLLEQSISEAAKRDWGVAILHSW